jgi:hypothetical protein
MNATYERALLKKTSIITNAPTDTSIPPGKYRAAVGFKFDADMEPDFAEYLVCQTMVDIQQWLQEGSDTEFGSFRGSALFQTNPESGIVTAIVLWKDHLCLDLDVGGSRYMVAETLSELICISPYEKELLSAQRFVVWAKKQITRNMIKNFERFLSDGEYTGKTNLLS